MYSSVCTVKYSYLKSNVPTCEHIFATRMSACVYKYVCVQERRLRVVVFTAKNAENPFPMPSSHVAAQALLTYPLTLAQSTVVSASISTESQ